MSRLFLRLTIAAALVLAGCDPDPHQDAYPPVGAVDGSEDEVVFQPGQVLTYEVTMAEADRDYMEAHGVGEEYLPASVTVRGGAGAPVELAAVGFRHKGGYGTLEMCWGEPTLDEDGDPDVDTHDEMLSRPRLDEAWCRKISYKLKFNEYVKGQDLHGLKKLNLHSGSRDPTMLHDILSYSLFYSAGIDAPRTAPVRLYINGDFMGLFIAVEDVDDRYAAHHYPEAAGGNVYKEAWPTPRFLDVLGPDYPGFVAAFQEEGEDPSDFVAFTTAVKTAVEQRSTAPLASLVDVDHLLRYLAVDRAIKNWDGLTALYTCEGGPSADLGCGPWIHNYFWYHDTGPEGRFHLVPWDLDNTLQYWDFFVQAHDGLARDTPIPNWNVKPADCQHPLLVWGTTWVLPSGCDPLLNLLASTSFERYQAIGRELLRGPLRTTELQKNARLWAQLIEPIVKDDPVIDYQAWRYERDVLIGDILVRLPGEFRAQLEQGYVEQR